MNSNDLAGAAALVFAYFVQNVAFPSASYMALREHADRALPCTKKMKKKERFSFQAQTCLLCNAEALTRP